MVRWLRSLVIALAALAAVPMAAVPVGAESPTFDTIASHEELTGDHATLFRLYWAFFDRAPDPGGALYWIEQRDACQELDTIAQSFAVSAEFVGRYGHLDDRDFIERIYGNVLDRPGDPSGVAYWLGLLHRGELTRGGVVLNVSLSAEFVARHGYPSDGVPARSCHLADGRPIDRSVTVVDRQPLATVAGLTVITPAAAIERAGFHQSSHPGAQAMDPAGEGSVRLTTMASRNRGTHERGAIDIVVEPATTITAPVSGTVARAGTYTLYCRYRDGYVVINPDGRPHLEVKVLHVQDVAVTPGQRIEVGQPIAGRATPFPFRSQVDALTAEPSWPHVHIEVVDPSIPRTRSGSC